MDFLHGTIRTFIFKSVVEVSVTNGTESFPIDVTLFYQHS